MALHTVIVDGLAVRYSDEGAGPVLLMLHGWMHTLTNFDAVAGILKDKYRVVRLDLSGFGGSEAPKSAWRVSDYAHCVASFVQKLELKPYALVGHSFGGRVILKGVGTGLLVADRIVLIASAGNARRSTARLTFYRYLARIIKQFAWLIPAASFARLRRAAYRYLKSDYADVGVLAEIFVNAIGEDLTSDAEHIDIPALLLWGSEDTITPPEDGKRLAQAIRHSEFQLYPGATHALHEERPMEVAAAVGAFL